MHTHTHTHTHTLTHTHKHTCILTCVHTHTHVHLWLIWEYFAVEPQWQRTMFQCSSSSYRLERHLQLPLDNALPHNPLAQDHPSTRTHAYTHKHTNTHIHTDTHTVFTTSSLYYSCPLHRQLTATFSFSMLSNVRVKADISFSTFYWPPCWIRRRGKTDQTNREIVEKRRKKTEKAMQLSFVNVQFAFTIGSVWKIK